MGGNCAGERVADLRSETDESWGEEASPPPPPPPPRSLPLPKRGESLPDTRADHSLRDRGDISSLDWLLRITDLHRGGGGWRRLRAAAEGASQARRRRAARRCAAPCSVGSNG